MLSRGTIKLAIVQIVSKHVFYYTEASLFIDDADFLEGKQFRVIEL